VPLNRCGKNLSVKVVQYHHDGNDIAVEYRPSVTWTYFLGRGIDDIVMRTDGTNRQYFYKNGLGSVVAVANNSGSLLESYEYNLQGQVAMFNGGGSSITSSSIGNDHLYTGRQLDPETGDYYYRARYYSPILGRFISRDPLSGAEFSQGSNLYAYCRNNGVNFRDPLGMCEEQNDPEIARIKLVIKDTKSDPSYQVAIKQLLGQIKYVSQIMSAIDMLVFAINSDTAYTQLKIRNDTYSTIMDKPLGEMAVDDIATLQRADRAAIESIGEAAANGSVVGTAGAGGVTATPRPSAQ
jgi:RHS repeat-associated protein